MVDILTNEMIIVLYGPPFTIIKETYRKIQQIVTVIDYIDRLYYICYKVTLSHDGSYIDSLKVLRNKKNIINAKHEENTCFKYVVAVWLNHT